MPIPEHWITIAIAVLVFIFLIVLFRPEAIRYIPGLVHPEARGVLSVIGFLLIVGVVLRLRGEVVVFDYVSLRLQPSMNPIEEMVVANNIYSPTVTVFVFESETVIPTGESNTSAQNTLTPTAVPVSTPVILLTPTEIPAMTAQSSLNAEYEVQWSQENYYQHMFALGDINGDTLADIGTFDDSGLVQIWFGTKKGLEYRANQSDVFLANQGSIMPLCDVNDDQFNDVFIAEDQGSGWFVFGSSDGLQFTQRQKIISGGWSPRGTTANDCFGDVTGDGIADVVMLTDTQIQVLSGGRDFPMEVATRSTMCSAPLWKQGLCNIGIAGDVNGDGIRDVSLMRTINGERVIELYTGQSSQMFEQAPLSVSYGVSSFNNGEFASSFSSVGDVNRDGFDDMGVTQYWNGVMLFLGSANGYSATHDWLVTGFDAATVSSAGDINDDGYDDLYVSSPWQATARIFLGNGSTLAFSAIWQETGDGHFGWPGGNAGDIDGNGKNDIFVGAHYTNGVAKVFLFR